MRKQFCVTKVTARHAFNAGARDLTTGRIRNTYNHPYHTHPRHFFRQEMGVGGDREFGKFDTCSRKSESKTRTKILKQLIAQSTFAKPQ